jgi:DNA polymerase-1
VTDPIVEQLVGRGVGRGDLMALAVAPGVGAALVPVVDSQLRATLVAAADPVPMIAAVDEALRPRWVEWSSATASTLVAGGLRVATAWDLVAVHRLLFGGWLADPARTWAQAQGLPSATIPTVGPDDLFSQAERREGDLEDPIRPDGHLRPEWVAGDWAGSIDRVARWATLAAHVAAWQQGRVAELSDRPRLGATARSESTAELLCAELAAEGLPMDRAVAEQIVAGFCGPRPRSVGEAAEIRAARDAEVLRHVDLGAPVDLRSAGQVKALLAAVGIDVPDTRAWRLKTLRDSHPVVGALLAWRKAERVATTYGYGWLDEHLAPDGRLRGSWTGSDGAAGRMTASAGLHNMPADMRSAVVAEPDHAFVRADLGQIEPRVLAAVSGDAALARATVDDDMYAPVAAALDVDRATAKVAVLGAMYGQTTGHGAQALRRLHAAYPVAMAYLDAADRQAQAGQDVFTYGGRRVRMGSGSLAPDADLAEREARDRAAARGRYGRNAVIQGAAAELFKVWAVTLRARAAPFDARIVLCLHDELLVHVPERHADDVAMLLDACLQEAAHRWAPDASVRFVADTSVIHRWSEAKG